MRARPWRWLLTRIKGLLTAETRLARHFAPDPEDPQEVSRGA